jgi:hypothetical protein
MVATGKGGGLVSLDFFFSGESGDAPRMFVLFAPIYNKDTKDIPVLREGREGINLKFYSHYKSRN